MSKIFEDWYEEQTMYLRGHEIRKLDDVKWFIELAWEAGKDNMKERLDGMDNLTKQREELDL